MSEPTPFSGAAVLIIVPLPKNRSKSAVKLFADEKLSSCANNEEGGRILVVNNTDNMRVTLEIDLEVAEEYRKNYMENFGTQEEEGLSLEDFLSRFLNDRLQEELEFVTESES